MAIEQSGGFCENCQKQVVTWKKAPSHVVHALLTLFTAGAWLIVWLVIAARSADARTWHCSQCGNPVVKKPSKAASAIGKVVGWVLVLLLGGIALILSAMAVVMWWLGV